MRGPAYALLWASILVGTASLVIWGASFPMEGAPSPDLGARPPVGMAALPPYGLSTPVEAGESGGVVINEILYDPQGPDSGYEFVELINGGPNPVSLSGWTLMAGDGARRDSWRTVWWGSLEDTIPPSGLFVIAEQNCPGGDSYAELSLQNGPDGCALAYDGRAVDIVGWGLHQFAEYYELAPAPDLPSGASLSRRPDGRDTGDNSADFTAGLPPTPGRPNTLTRDLSFGENGIEVCPINPDIHERVDLKAYVVNGGFGFERIDEFTLNLGLVDLGSGSSLPLRQIDSAVAPGDTVTIEATWDPAHEGRYELTGCLVFPGDQDSAGDFAAVRVRVGPGPLVINEIMYDPITGGEWIEIFNRSDYSGDLCGWKICDRAGGHVEIRYPVPMSTNELVVIAQDSVALMRRFTGLEAKRVIGSYSGRWISLNNSDGPDGLAEVVTLSDGVGTPCDVSCYSERTGGSGVSVERLRPDLIGRRRDNWVSSVAPAGGTPGAKNSAGVRPAVGSGLLSISPPIVSYECGGVGMAMISYNLPFRPSRLRLAIYSIDGREVALLLERSNGPVEGTVPWNGLGSDGALLAAGAYVVLLSGVDENGKSAEAKAVVAVR